MLSTFELIWVMPPILSIISNIFLKKKIERDGYLFINGYKFLSKESLFDDIAVAIIPILNWVPCIFSLLTLFRNKSYKEHINTLVKDKSLLITQKKAMEILSKQDKDLKLINPSIIEEKVSPKKETKVLPKKDKRININSRDTKVMIEIGYLLELIKQVDLNLYEKKYKEYRDMLLAGTNGLTLSRTSDYVFLEEFKLGLEEILEKDKDKITLRNFEKTKLEYEKHFLEQNVKTKLTFNDIENMAKKYLQERKNYSPTIYNMIINYLSYFYLLELYENRNSLNIEELQNTEFERVFLYGVLKTIKELQSKGIIEDNLEIDMIEVPTLENVIKAIQDIKIVNIDKPKTLTLKN